MYLFITNGELSLRLFVVVGKVLQLLDCIRRGDRDAELDVPFCIFMTRLRMSVSTSVLVDVRSTHINLGVIRQCGERLIQGFVHFGWCAFEEPPTATNEESVTSEDSTVVSCRVLE